MARNSYGVNFGGRRIVHPGGYDSIDGNAMTSVSPGGLNLPIVVGTSDAGRQNSIQYFSDLESARSYLRGGSILTALEIMFSPSSEGGGGASLVGVQIVNPTTQASLIAGGLAQTSNEFGVGGNRIQAKLEDGTLSGSKKYTVSRWDLSDLEIYDNVGTVMQVQYTGSQLYAAITVDAVNGVASSLITKIGADSASSQVDLTLDLTSSRFATIDDIVTYISSVSGYTAKLLNVKSSGLPSSTLDSVSAISILGPYNVMALKGDLAYQISNSSQLVTIATSSAPISNFGLTYFSGGSVGATPASWAVYFDAIKKEFSDILVVLSSDAAIHAEALAHVGSMVNRNQKQMLFTGGGTGETPDRAKQRVVGLNSSRAVLGYPGIFHGANGGKIPLPAYYTGALIAGRVSGVPFSEPVTFDYVSVLGLENNLIVGDPDIDDLITSGVCTLEKVQGGGIRIVQGITTYLGSNNSLYREISSRRGADALSETVRSTLEAKFVGKKGIRATSSAVTTTVIDILEQAIRDTDIVLYRNIAVRITSGIIYVDYEVAQAEPTNFILVTTHFVPTTL